MGAWGPGAFENARRATGRGRSRTPPPKKTPVDADFSGAKLHEGSLSVPPVSVYRDCTFDRADLRQCSSGLARLERCSFDHTRIDGWICDNDFVDCTFAGRFRNIQFSGRMNPTLIRVRGVPMCPNEFRGTDFVGARFIYVDFTGGIDLDAQKLPTGPEYHRFDIRPQTVARVERLIPSLPAEEQEQKEARDQACQY